MDYNSTRKKLVLPEYGRHIQKMVDHALTIEDREERKKAAQTIISVMGNMFPHLRDVSDFKHKLWDHLAIMSDFKLDIDFPYDLPKRENLYTKPKRVPYNDRKIIYRHYGSLVEQLIKKAIELEDEEERKQLIMLIAAHMKKALYYWNKDSVTDDRIFDDIKKMSGGKLVVEEGAVIPDYRENNYRNRKKNQQKKRNQNKKNIS
ncbi:MAG: DUF4290 domain-containing protein [Chlorobi bacterium]|nr:DUF4290 domain-containing protein [Chlorobiota bacterium]